MDSDLEFTFEELAEALPSMLGVDSSHSLDAEAFLKECSVRNPRLFKFLLDLMLVRKAYHHAEKLF